MHPRTKALLRWLLGLFALGAFSFAAVTRIPTRLAVYLNHSLNIPRSAHDVKFGSYRNFLGIDGDGSIAYFTVPKPDFDAFLAGQKWCNHCYGNGIFYPFPDSLLHKYPIKEVECKAPKGDVLLISADTIPQSSELRICLCTDWN